MAIRLRSTGPWGGAALIATLLTTRASAQVNDQANTAEDLYRRGLTAFEAQDYVNACPALMESYHIDPLPGALFTVATCELKAGKIATAFRRFGEFINLINSLAPAQQQQQSTRRAVAEQQRRDLSMDLPYIRIAWQGASPSDVQIYLNGTLLPPESIGIEFAVDPGEQVVEQRRAGRALSTQRVVIAKGERKAVTLVVQDLAPPQRIPTGPIRQPVTTSHALAYSIAGVGIVGLTLGSVTGVLAVHEKGIVNDECKGTICSARGKRAADFGKADGLVSTVGFGVGIAGLAISTVMLLRPSRPASSAADYRLPALAVTPRSITVTGAF